MRKFIKWFWLAYYHFAPVSIMKTKTDVIKWQARTKGIPLKDAKMPIIHIDKIGKWL